MRKRYRSKVAETHRQLLRFAPVPPIVVDEWAKMTRKAPEITVDDAAEHLARYCTPETVGHWAYALVGQKDRRPGGYVRRRVLEAFEQATWEQKVCAIFQSLGYLHSIDVPDAVWDAGEITAPVMATIADSAVELHTDNLSDRARNGTERALQMLGLNDLSGAVIKNWNAAANKLSKAEIEALLDSLEPGISRTDEAGVPDSAIPAPIRTSLSPAAVVVLRARECRDVETYFMESLRTELSSETLYLASALTHRPHWVVLFEVLVNMTIEGKQTTVNGARGTWNGQYVEVKFAIDNGASTSPSVRIPIGTGKRKYSANRVGHAAMVVLDLLFSREENLETSRASGDEVFARKRLSPVGITASAIYRLAERPVWATAERRSRLSLGTASVSRRAHDVRGHFRIVRGIEYPVQPHRRQS